MPRSNRPRRRGRPHAQPRHTEEDEPRPLNLGGMQRQEGEWMVRRVSGNSSGRTYVCPGCQQQVAAASAHVVAWPVNAPVGSGQAVESRRHWHSPCWAARGRRRPS